MPEKAKQKHQHRRQIVKTKCVCRSAQHPASEPDLWRHNMNIFVLHVLADMAAKLHCDKHANKQVLEATQILYTVLILMKIDTSMLGVQPYRKTHEKHPCTLWALACKTHAYWLLDFAIALGVLRHNVYKTSHKSTDHLEAMKRTRCFDSLPENATPVTWAEQLKTLGCSQDNIKSCLSKVAFINPPHGCSFGVVCVDIPEDMVDTVMVYDNNDIDLVETYRRYMVYKSKRTMSFEWFFNKLPPEEYNGVFQHVMPDEHMLSNKEVLAMNERKRELKKRKRGIDSKDETRSIALPPSQPLI